MMRDGVRACDGDVGIDVTQKKKQERRRRGRRKKSAEEEWKIDGGGR